MSGLETGELAKMKLSAYSDPDCKTAVGGLEYTVMFNPSAIASKYAIEYNVVEADGTTNDELKFKKIKPQDFTFDFVIDGTGIANPLKGSIKKEIESFLNVVYNYNGDNHRPNYVKLVFGDFVFKGALIAIDINYTLISSAGQPIRAKIVCTFRSTASKKQMDMEMGNNSPDVTHKRIYKEYQTFTGLAFGIYERNDLYAEVAGSNGLNNFRRIEPGTELFFPPLG